MPRVNLLGEPYAGQSLIASGQQAINLYAESNKEAGQAPAPITYYQFPGTELFGEPLNPNVSRCTYRTSIGTVYSVVGSSVYQILNNGAMIFVGSIADRPSQVYMYDNGLAIVLVDGTEGWAIDMSNNNFGQIIDPSFYGADFVLFLDTFFIFNRPDTNQFYISLSMADYTMLTSGTAFDPLDIAAKAGSADPIVALATVNKNLWLIGELTTEIWYGTGAADFFFQAIQGAYVNRGCIAPYSVISTDTIVIWLSQDRIGKNIIVKTVGYDVEEISTPALVKDFNSYETTADAIGMCLQTQDHAFYILQFPTANKTWAKDLLSYWFQLGKWNVETNTFDRYRANCCCFGFGLNLIGDFQTGNVYKLNPNVFTDGGDPIKWVRTFLHMVGPEFQRITYKNCDLDMEVGNADAPVDPETDDDNPAINPMVQLSWSDDRGKTFGFPIEQSLGQQGEYLTTVSFNRLGMARDRIFKVEWSAPVRTAIQGGFVEVSPSKT